METKIKMQTENTTTTAKRVPITSYLAMKGIMPVLEIGGEYVYFSPFSKERTPSFFVNHSRNLFKDFSSGNGGDAIKLVQDLEGAKFIDALRILQSVNQDFEIELQQNLPASPQHQSFVKRIQPLKNKVLIQYLSYERGLNIDAIKSEVSELHYFTSKGDFFSVGFKNESDGWELRNPKFKGCIGKKDISIRGDRDGNMVKIFEGFIDYLSFITVAGKRTFPNTKFIILNSLTMLNRLPDLSDAAIVSLYLDNDEAGIKAADKLCSQYEQAYNMSRQIYPNNKDYNEFITRG